jgi:hypothetical protein
LWYDEGAARACLFWLERGQVGRLSQKGCMKRDSTSHNLFPHGRWLVCRPKDYDVRYQINPWMDLSRLPEKALAGVQWNNLHHHILRLGGWLEYVDHADGWPDMVFTANAGLV